MSFTMKFLSCMTALTGLASAAALPVEHKALSTRDACSDGPYAPVLVIGGTTPTNFCESRINGNGEIITALEVWWDKHGITGILFTYSGDPAMMHGRRDKDSKSITIGPGEIVQMAALYGDGSGTNLGHIYLKTDKQEFDVGKEIGDTKMNPIEVGGGILLGGSGGIANDRINNFGWYFLNSKIDHIGIGEIKFDTDPTGTSTNIEPSYLVQTTFGNPKGSTGNLTFTVSGSESVTTTTSYEQSTKGSFGGTYNYELSAEVFGIGAKGSGTYAWTVEHTTTQSTSTSKAVVLTNSIGPLSIAPGYGKNCQIVAQKGTGNFPYSSTVTLYLADHSTHTYKEPGILNNVQFSKAEATCSDQNDNSQWAWKQGDGTSPPPGVSVNH